MREDKNVLACESTGYSPFLLSPLQVPDGQQGGEQRPRKVASTRMWLSARRRQGKTRKSQPIGYSREKMEVKAAKVVREATQAFFWLVVPSTKSSHTSKAWRVSLMNYSTCQNMQEEEWKSGRAVRKDSAAGSSVTTSWYQAKPTTTIPCHTLWPRLQVALHNVQPR